MNTFEATHVVMTQQDGIDPDCVHFFKFGTPVEWLGTCHSKVKVVDKAGMVQFVELPELRLTTVLGE